MGMEINKINPSPITYCNIYMTLNKLFLFFSSLICKMKIIIVPSDRIIERRYSIQMAHRVCVYIYVCNYTQYIRNPKLVLAIINDVPFLYNFYISFAQISLVPYVLSQSSLCTFIVLLSSILSPTFTLLPLHVKENGTQEV